MKKSSNFYLNVVVTKCIAHVFNTINNIIIWVRVAFPEIKQFKNIIIYSYITVCVCCFCCGMT